VSAVIGYADAPGASIVEIRRSSGIVRPVPAAEVDGRVGAT
jgi:hypothetical protein